MVVEKVIKDIIGNMSNNKCPLGGTGRHAAFKLRFRNRSESPNLSGGIHKTEMNGKHDCFVLKYAFSFKLSTIEPPIQVASFMDYE